MQFFVMLMATGKQSIKGFFASFVRHQQIRFISEWNKEKYERIVICIFLVFFVRIKYFVIDKSGRFLFFVISFAFLVKTVLIVIGNKIVQTNVFQLFRPIGIVTLNKSLLKDVFAHFLQFPSVFCDPSVCACAF